MNTPNWSPSGSRLNMPKPSVCIRANRVREIDNRIYCYGINDRMYDAPIAMCKTCVYHVDNMPDLGKEER